MTNADRPSLRIAVFGEAHALWPVAAALLISLGMLVLLIG